MKRKELLIEVAQRFRKVRETLGLSPANMVGNLKTHRITYYKYESARTLPQFSILARLGKNLGISMDWLILNKGPMFYKEKDNENKAAADPLAALPQDIKELVEHMQRIPMLKYETLLSFHHFKENHKDMVESAFKEKMA